MEICYEIGGMSICLSAGDMSPRISEYSRPFMRPEPSPGEEILRFVCRRGEYKKPENTRGSSYKLYPDSGGERAHYSYLKDGSGFSFSSAELEGDSVTIDCADGLGENMPEGISMMSLCGLHSLLLKRNMPVLHASYIDIGGEALLFAGQSGVGKSTQAENWRKYLGAEIINGDRVLLKEISGVWHACGYPACGSSKICLDRTLPVRAIILPQHAGENSLSLAPPREAARKLLGGIDVFHWYTPDIERALTLASSIAGGVPVYNYSCRVDLTAAEYLKNAIL